MPSTGQAGRAAVLFACANPLGCQPALHAMRRPARNQCQWRGGPYFQCLANVRPDAGDGPRAESDGNRAEFGTLKNDTHILKTTHHKFADHQETKPLTLINLGHHHQELRGRGTS